ncbi:hypothetical protein KR026_002749, partial [Drosophila bipectinata]
MMILAGLGQATGYPNYSYPWKWNHYNKARSQQYIRDQKDPKRPLRPKASHEDPEALFRRLDDMERRGEKERMAERIMHPEWEKGSVQMNAFHGGPKISPAQLYRDNFSHYGSDVSDHGEMELDDPFASIAHDSYNARSGEVISPYDSTDREIERILEYGKDTSLQARPSMAKANLLAKVVSNNGDQQIKRLPTKNLLCTQRPQTFPTIRTRPTTTTRATTRQTTTTKTTRIPFSTFCMPDPTTSTTSRPPPLPQPSPHPPYHPSPLPKPIPKDECAKKSKILNASTAKMILETILESKQHALAVLKNLNYMEMEVLSLASETCPRMNPKPKFDSKHRGRVMSTKYGEKMEAPRKPPSTFGQSSPAREFPAFSFGIRPISKGESPSALAIAREEELKLEERVWDEHLNLMRARRPWKPKRARAEAAPPEAVHLEPLPNKQPQDFLEELDADEPVEKENPLEFSVVHMPMESEVPDVNQLPKDPHRINVQALSVIVKPVVPAEPSEESVLPAPDTWGSPVLSQTEMQGPLRNEWEPTKHRKNNRRRKKKKHRLYKQQ